MRSFFPRVLAVIAVLSAASCSSQFSSTKAEGSGGVQLSAQQKKEQIAQLAPHLQGEWTCAGSANGLNQCFGETLTFSSALDSLTIQNNWHFCVMNTDYQLTMGVEDSAGMTDFSIHANALGQLVGPSATSVDCKNYLATFSDKPLDENFSFTHSSDWSQITIGDNNFSKIPSIAPSQSPNPEPSSSTQPSNS